MTAEGMVGAPTCLYMKEAIQNATSNGPLMGRLYLRFKCAVWICSKRSAAMTCFFHVQLNMLPIALDLGDRAF
jgi:hypothetical protein